MNRYKKAIIEITRFDVPPADRSCCYRMQGAVYEIKGIAEAAISNRRSGGLHPPTNAALNFCNKLWNWIIGKNSGRA